MTTTRSTVVAVYRNNADAQGAAAELKANGFSSNDIYISEVGQTGTNTRDVESAGYGSHHHHEGGITGWFKSLFGHEDETDQDTYRDYENAVSSGNVLLTVETDDQSVEAVGDILDRFNPVDMRRENARDASAGTTATGGTTTGAAVAAGTTSGSTAGRDYSAATQGAGATTGGTARRVEAAAGQAEGQSIPVVHEELRVGKRRILRGGVRVYTRVVEQPVEESVRLREEKVRVDRQPVDRPVAESDLRAGRDQVIEVQEYAEEPVVAKQARVVEEVRVQKEATERDQTVRDTVRRTEVRVEGINAENAGQAGTAAQTDYDADYRRDFQTNYGTSGANYDEYAPAYRYGYEMANDPRYRGRKFDEVESDLRADYGQRYPNSAWDRFKNSIRYGWDKVTGKANAATTR